MVEHIQSYKEGKKKASQPGILPRKKNLLKMKMKLVYFQINGSVENVLPAPLCSQRER